MNEYIKQAKDFLANTNTTLTIKRAPFQESPLWATGREHGVHYKCELANDRGRYVFDYWDSVHNKQLGKRPSAYDVLACLDGHIDQSMSIDDFASEYGYSEEQKPSVLLATYNSVIKQARELERLFTQEQRDQLGGIN